MKTGSELGVKLGVERLSTLWDVGYAQVYSGGDVDGGWVERFS
jgi:hypothetical protein